jgi:hypothetical protein
LLTLTLHKEALARGAILKDASAYNVQFVGSKPIFIDLLSFDMWRSGQPWQAYQQFCKHFLAPLALIVSADLHCVYLLKLWVEGISLELASHLLPVKSYFSFALLWHIHLHARLLAKSHDGRSVAQKARSVRVSKDSLFSIAKSLKSAVESIQLSKEKTPWGKYYEDTNYTEAATKEKMRIVTFVAERLKGKLAIDLGANTGRYSQLLAPYFDLVLAPDGDVLAVEQHYLSLKAGKCTNILPLVLDLANPSPALGWACRERSSFKERCSADLLLSLALVHHLVITAGIPFEEIVKCFSELLAEGGCALVEFIPKEDSQIQRMLAAREDVFKDYTEEHFKGAFSCKFSLVERFSVRESDRTLYLFKKL